MSPVPVPGGVVFWAPPSPLPPFPQGSGFPPGVRASPRGQGPPWVRTSRPALPGDQAFRGPGFPPCFHVFRRPGARLPPCFQEARLPGAGVRGFHASMLSGLQVSGHPPCFSPLLSGDHAARLSGFFLTSRPAFMLSGGHASMLSGGHASMLSGGPASRWPGSALLPRDRHL